MGGTDAATVRAGQGGGHQRHRHPDACRRGRGRRRRRPRRPDHRRPPRAHRRDRHPPRRPARPPAGQRPPPRRGDGHRPGRHRHARGRRGCADAAHAGRGKRRARAEPRAAGGKRARRDRGVAAPHARARRPPTPTEKKDGEMARSQNGRAAENGRALGGWKRACGALLGGCHPAAWGVPRRCLGGATPRPRPADGPVRITAAATNALK